MSGTHFLRSILFTGGFLFFSLLSLAQAPVFTIQNKKDACDGLPNGSFEVLVSAATTGLTIQVFGPPNQGPFSPTVGVPFLISNLQGTLAGKNYLVVVADDNDNSFQPVTIFTIANITASISGSTNNSNCGAPNGAIDISATGGSGNFTYLWTGPAGFVNPATQDLSGISGGSYNVTITDISTNCTRALGPIIITDPSPLVFNAATTTTPICAGAGGTVTLSNSEVGVTYEIFKNAGATGITLPGTGSALSFTIPAGQLTPAAVYNFTIRAVNGLCTPVFMNGTAAITVNALPTTSAITGTSPVCANTNGVAYSVTNTAGSTYVWTITGGTQATGTNTNSITVNWGVAGAGNVQVVETNAANCPGTPVNLPVTISANPTTSAITGTSPVCANTNGVAYSVTNTAGSTYVWTITGGTQATGTNTNSITVNWGVAGAGNVQVVETNAATCVGTAVNLPVTINATPTTSAITGTSPVCANTNGVAYSVVNTAGSTYAWTITGGTQATGTNTNSITVNWGAAGAGNVQVVETNAGCVGTAVNFPVTITAPVTSAITGTSPVCANTNGVVYSVTLTAGSTYAWTITGGTQASGTNTNSITVNWGAAGAGNVQVVETNAATCVGTAVNFPVTINAPTTSAITGTSPVCANTNGVAYSVTLTAGSTYAWTITGGTQASGTNTNSITVNWGAAGAGNVQVVETSAATCVGTAVNFPVTINANPTTSAITGTSPVCANTNGVVYSVTNTVNSTYVWTITGGTQASGTNTNSITVNWGAAGAGNVQVVETNAATCVGTAVNFPVTITAPVTSAITGTSPVCANTNGVAYSVTITAGSTYAWTITGGTQATGTNTNSITVNWGAAGAGNVQVVETNAGTCVGTAVNFPVTINAPATSAITGTSPVCANTNGVAYSVVNTAGSTYVWTITGGTQASGTDTNSITVNWGVAGAGNVQVVETNAATCVGTAVNFPVTISANPTTSAITGTSPVCANTNGVAYSVTNTAGSTYVWTITGGTQATGTNTNSITVNWGAAGAGNVQVVETNAATCVGTAVNFPVTINANPTTSAITGTSPVCANTNGVAYSVTITAGSTYAWTITGGTQASGTNTNSITVNWGAAGAGNVQVVETNAATCVGTAINFPVTITAPVTSAITGTSPVCANTNGVAYSVTITAGSTYAWTITGGIQASGTNTNSITVNWGAAGAGNVQVVETSAATCVGTAVNFPVTINANPTTSAITGTSPVCANTNGVTYSVTNTAGSTYVWTITGGTQASGTNTNSITVNWGAAGAGNVQVVETNAATCAGTAVNFPVTINANPTTSAITGTSPVCANTNGVAYSVTNTAGSAYVWTITGGTQASGTNTNSITVDWGTAGAGNVQVVETNAATCVGTAVNLPVTINAPATVDAGNPASVCAGGAVTLAGTRGGSAVASIWSTAGDGLFNNVLLLNAAYTPGFNDITNGSVTLTLTTNDPAGPCIAATDNVLITVIASANLNLPVAATTSPICSGGATTITVATSEVGVSYQLRNDAGDINIGPAVVGTGGTIALPTGALTVNTTFNVLTTGPGCPAAEQNTMATVNVAGNVNAGLTVTAAASTICEGSSTNIQVFSSEAGVNYQLRNDAGDINVGAPVAGTGGTINLPTGVLTATTVFNVFASNGTCSIELTDIETVTVDIAPDPSLTVGKTIDPLCAGGVSAVTVALSEIGVSYQLRNDAGDVNVGTPVAGTGGTINLSTGALAATTTFNVFASSGVCTPVELTTLATVNVAGAINAGLTVTAATSPICEGSATDIQVFSSEVGVNYQLRNDAGDVNVGAPVAGTGGTINLNTGALTATTVFNVLASNVTCSIELTDIETVTVNIAPDPSLTVGKTIDPLCAGGTSAITVALSEVGVSYQLRNDAGDVNVGAPVAGTGGTINLSTGVLAVTTTFNVFASSGVCPSVELTTLATVTVAGAINAGLTLSASANPICAGTSTNVQVQASEVGVNYQLRNDAGDVNVGAPVAGTGGTINLPTGNLAVATTFNVLASNVTCAIELTNTQTITVNAGPNIGLAVNATPALICTGTSSSITVANSEVGVNYQLRNNAGNALVGTAVAGTGANIVLPTGNLAVNTTFNVLANGAGCSAQLTALATVTIRPVGDPACAGGTNCFAFTVTTVEQRPSCALQDDGSITFTITGGTPNYIVTLSDGAGFNVSLPGPGPNFTFTDLSPADYTYTIQDAAGNVCGLPYSLPVQTNVNAVASGFVNAACFGEATGQATITVQSGGASPYFYSLDNGGSWLSFTSPHTITNLPPNGTYSILVADDPSDQCPAEVSVTIGNTNPSIKGIFVVTNASCNVNDGAIDITSTTGGAGGPYTFKVDGVSKAEPFTSLSGGSHIISMIDNTGCARDTAITVTFPGFVAYSAPATTIDATCTTKGVIGIFIPNPPGSYEVGFTTDPINQPTNYNSGYYNPATGLVIINKLDAGTYYVWIRTSAAACPTRFENSPGVYEVIIGGPQPISFEVGCRDKDGVLTLNNISASSTDPVFYEIFGNGFQKSGQVSPNAMAQDTIHGFTTGSYVVWLRQDQSTYGCTVYSDTLSAPAGSLDTLAVTKNKSFPDQPTGSIEVKLRGSGAEPYEAWLVETTFNSDTLTAVRNPVIFEVNFSSLAAATYSLFIEDAAGCRKEYVVIIPSDDSIFIPNVFTPNNDGVNEQFYVRNLPSSGSKLSITNRWGKEVYSSNNYNPDNLWNGGGTPDGVYYYRLQISGGGTYTGWVEIVRGVKP